MQEKPSSHGRPRMVVEEVETSEEPQVSQPKPEILDEGAKVSSEELENNDNVQLVEDKPEKRSEEKVEKLEEESTDEKQEGSESSSLSQDMTPPSMPEIPAKKSPLIALWIIIPGIFLLGALLGGIYFYEKGASVLQKNATPTPAPTPVIEEASPSATPVVSVDLTKYKIAVYNGSGIVGEAGNVKNILTTAGYSVNKIANAATYDYTKTIIKAQASVDPSFITALSNILSKTYAVDTPQPLSSSSSDMVQVVVGSTKAQ